MISSIIYLLKKIETSFSARYLVERNGSGKQARELIDNLTKMSEKKKKMRHVKACCLCRRCSD